MLLYFKHVRNDLLTDSTALWIEVKNGIIYCRDNCVKLKKFNVKPMNKTPWFNKSLVKLSKKRNKFYLIAIDSLKHIKDKNCFFYKQSLISIKSTAAWSAYIELKNLFSKSFRLAKSDHFKDFVNKSSLSESKFWKYIDPYINPNKRTKLQSSDLSNDDRLLTDQDC